MSRRKPRLISRPWVLALAATILVGIVSTQLSIQRAKRLSRPVDLSGMERLGLPGEKTAVPPPLPPPASGILIGGSVFRGPPRFRQSYTMIVGSFETGYLFRTAIGGGWSPERIDAPLSRITGWGSDSVEFSIWSDAAGQPGVKLATFIASGITKDVRVSAATQSSPPCTLAGGGEYWLLATTRAGEINWNLEINTITGKHALRKGGNNSGRWQIMFPAENVPAFCVYGSRVPQPPQREIPTASTGRTPNIIIGGSTLRSPPQ